MYVLHSLQGHASGFHDLINFLNLLKKLLYLILFGTSSQIFGPKFVDFCYKDLQIVLVHCYRIV